MIGLLGLFAVGSSHVRAEQQPDIARALTLPIDMVRAKFAAQNCKRTRINMKYFETSAREMGFSPATLEAAVKEASEEYTPALKSSLRKKGAQKFCRQQFHEWDERYSATQEWPIIVGGK
jgi:membrane-bound lytic murein transglycosylase B